MRGSTPTSTLMIERLNQQGDHTHDWDPQVTEDGTPVTLAEMRGQGLRAPDRGPRRLSVRAGRRADPRRPAHPRPGARRRAAASTCCWRMVRVPNLDVPEPARRRRARRSGCDLDALRRRARRATGRRRRRLARRWRRRIVATHDATRSRRSTALCATAARRGCTRRLAADDAVRARTLAAVRCDVDRPAADAAAHAARSSAERLVPSLRDVGATTRSTTSCARSTGGYVPAGPSGAPTRGMAHVLPTGRNFYAVDPRTMPSRPPGTSGSDWPTSWSSGTCAKTGAYPRERRHSASGAPARCARTATTSPRCLRCSACGRSGSRRAAASSASRSSRWRSWAGRASTSSCRISGFFRDAFPHVIALLDDAVDRSPRWTSRWTRTSSRAHYLAEQRRGCEPTGVRRRARRAQRAATASSARKPGTYGAGILPLIDERQLARRRRPRRRPTSTGAATPTPRDDVRRRRARASSETVLGQVEVAVKNQDNREHDIFDSDDYLQFHGGMIATIRALTGPAARARYFGDTSDPARARGPRPERGGAARLPHARGQPEVDRRASQRHGYKGALELAATVDYLFGYDATAHVVDDWMYEQVTRTLRRWTPTMQAFFERSNPWALEGHRARGCWKRCSAACGRNPSPTMRGALEQRVPGGGSSARGAAPNWTRVPVTHEPALSVQRHSSARSR